MSGETQTVTDSTGTATVTPPKPTPVAPPASPYAYEDVFCKEDGKRWREKFYGAQGVAKQQEAQRMTVEGEMSTKVEQLEGKVSELTATIAQMTADNAVLKGEADTIPALNEQIASLTEESKKATRYRKALDYPGLLGLSVEEEVTGDDGNVTKVATNPVLTLLENADMPEDMLDKTLQQMNTALSAADQARAAQVSRTAMGPATPAPPESTGDDLQSLIAQANELKAQYNATLDMSLMDKHSEVSRKIRELEIEQARRRTS